MSNPFTLYHKVVQRCRHITMKFCHDSQNLWSTDVRKSRVVISKKDLRNNYDSKRKHAGTDAAHDSGAVAYWPDRRRVLWCRRIYRRHIQHAFLKLSTAEKTKNLELAKAVLQAETNKQLKDYRKPGENREVSGSFWMESKSPGCRTMRFWICFMKWSGNVLHREK